MRKEIWRRIFPKSVNYELDIEKLSRLSLPGGSIRNIAVNAAFFAAGDGDVILMPHISKAAKAEYDKLEKSFSISNLNDRMNPNVELHIDELVLHGVNVHDRYAVAEAVENELTRLFKEQGIPSPSWNIQI